MPEYIEREPLLEKRWDVPFETEDAHFVQVVDVLDIMLATAADVAPVRHGRWVQKPQMYRHPNARNYYCSECREEVMICGNYCPNCGARMDGGCD